MALSDEQIAHTLVKLKTAKGEIEEGLVDLNGVIETLSQELKERLGWANEP